MSTSQPSELKFDEAKKTVSWTKEFSPTLTVHIVGHYLYDGERYYWYFEYLKHEPRFLECFSFFKSFYKNKPNLVRIKELAETIQFNDANALRLYAESIFEATFMQKVKAHIKADEDFRNLKNTI